MAGYVARRLIQSIFVLVVVLTLVFFAGRVIGNPAALILGPEARAEDVKTLEERFGYDKPPFLCSLGAMHAASYPETSATPGGSEDQPCPWRWNGCPLP